MLLNPPELSPCEVRGSGFAAPHEKHAPPMDSEWKARLRYLPSFSELLEKGSGVSCQSSTFLAAERMNGLVLKNNLYGIQQETLHIF